MKRVSSQDNFMSSATDQLKSAIDLDLQQSQTVKDLTDRVSKLESMFTVDGIAELMTQALSAGNSAPVPQSNEPTSSGS